MLRWRIQPKITTFYYLGWYLFNQSLQKSFFFSFSKRGLSFKIQTIIKRCFLSNKAKFLENPEMLEFPKSEQSTQNSGRSTRKSKMEQQFKLRNFWKSRHTFFWSLETGVRRQWNASKVTLLWILCVYCAYVFTKYVPQGGDTLLLYRKLLFLGVAVGVTLLHSFWTTSKALPKTFSLWTQKVHFSGQRNAPSGQLYFVHPKPPPPPYNFNFPLYPQCFVIIEVHLR